MPPILPRLGWLLLPWLWHGSVVAAPEPLAGSQHASSPRGTAPDGFGEPAPSIISSGCSWPCYVHTFLDVGVGKALRLNNPYRLQTQLGSSPESLSATATTLETSVAALLGAPSGWHHGLSLGASLALGGLPQQVITPSYALARPLGERFWWRARLGVGFVTQPDFNAGIEAATEFVAMASAGLGMQLGLVYAQYWGAGTDETQATSIPIIGAQVGATVIYEVLP